MYNKNNKRNILYNILIFLACNCSVVGSKNLFCDDFTGQCPCKDGLEGRTCNSCPKNHFGFPNCKPCKCYGHSSTCDTATGACNSCLHNTIGINCQLCKEGYYGNAQLGLFFSDFFLFLYVIFILSPI